MLNEPEARQRAADIASKLQTVSADILQFFRDKGHVALGYADSRAGKNQCASEQWGKSLSTIYRWVQAFEVADLLPDGEQLSGRAARALSGLTSEVAQTVIEIARQTSGKVTESSVIRTIEAMQEVLVTGSFPDGDGGQVSVQELLSAGVAGEIVEARQRHMERLAPRDYIIPAHEAIVSEWRSHPTGLEIKLFLKGDFPQFTKRDVVNVSIWQNAPAIAQNSTV